MQERFRQHWRALHYRRHDNELMQKDCDDYGLDSFTFSVIDEVASYAERGKEHEWMRRFNSTNPELGYNYNEKITNREEWSEPEWVTELRARVGKQPQKSSIQRSKEETSD